MKKGFTLIEVLAVITLIAILTVIIMPNILNNVNNEKEGVSDSAKKMIYDAADIYMKDNSEIYPSTDGSNYCIKLETLVNSGKLVSPIKDMKKDKEIPLNYYVKATANEYNQFDYELVDNNNCEEKNPIKIIYNVPTGYAKSKKVTLTFPSGNFIKKYKILSGTTEENIELNKEFTTDKEEVNLTFKSNGKLEATLLNKETNDEITKKTIKINNIDNNNPTITDTIIDRSGKIKYTISDSESGLKDYCINNTNSIDNCEWIKINNSPLNYTFTYTISKANDYYIHIRDIIDNTYISKEPLKITNSNLCQYDINKTWKFSYTGNAQTFTIPCTGKYKLETWGAQGDVVANTGFGGYSTGTIDLNKNYVLYIVVGQSGQYAGVGGYNGGGKGSLNNDSTYGYSTGGGGATHIATETGLLATLSSKKSSVIIVAGGGGGHSGWENNGAGGHAGGYIGNNGQYNYYGTGGTQTTGGTGSEGASNGSFGAGGYQTNPNCSTGGGGSGWYGGGAGCNGGGAGGSGYIGNSSLTNKVMYCYNCTKSSEESTKTISNTCVSSNPTLNCSKQGDGYARITYLGD